MKKRYYIAYGSNLNTKQMRFRCPEAKIVGTAILEDWELLFKGSKTGSYLTIEKKKGCKVPVAVWEVTELNEKRLDIYEGFPDFYYKKDMEILVKDLKNGTMRKRKVFVYIMHEERPIGVPSLHYLMTCAEGYRDIGFNTNYIDEAYNKSLEACKK